ncbi:hypothetical protein TvY486_0022300 [Trypanosoma vivax Y486]|uniref:Uncharacterized protein n=1 Tax=Trypanosoma vivax (strain Y486) TaxID=1055687 RepID=F9WPQ6_TRYVY|nr:hypothetical protein TvY486_0022300 [Trypanosoma vivax Y486]|eukprot:CCD19533.1 hypothetical protein TvY486_0022300 [Trypanosoma vivax Y486]
MNKSELSSSNVLCCHLPERYISGDRMRGIESGNAPSGIDCSMPENGIMQSASEHRSPKYTRDGIVRTLSPRFVHGTELHDQAGGRQPSPFTRSGVLARPGVRSPASRGDNVICRHSASPDYCPESKLDAKYFTLDLLTETCLCVGSLRVRASFTSRAPLTFDHVVSVIKKNVHMLCFTVRVILHLDKRTWKYVQLTRQNVQHTAGDFKIVVEARATGKELRSPDRSGISPSPRGPADESQLLEAASTKCPSARANVELVEEMDVRAISGTSESDPLVSRLMHTINKANLLGFDGTCAIHSAGGLANSGLRRSAGASTNFSENGMVRTTFCIEYYTSSDEILTSEMTLDLQNALARHVSHAIEVPQSCVQTRLDAMQENVLVLTVLHDGIHTEAEIGRVITTFEMPKTRRSQLDVCLSSVRGMQAITEASFLEGAPYTRLIDRQRFEKLRGTGALQCHDSSARKTDSAAVPGDNAATDTTKTNESTLVWQTKQEYIGMRLASLNNTIKRLEASRPATSQQPKTKTNTTEGGMQTKENQRKQPLDETGEQLVRAQTSSPRIQMPPPLVQTEERRIQRMHLQRLKDASQERYKQRQRIRETIEIHSKVESITKEANEEQVKRSSSAPATKSQTIMQIRQRIEELNMFMKKSRQKKCDITYTKRTEEQKITDNKNKERDTTKEKFEETINLAANENEIGKEKKQIIEEESIEITKVKEIQQCMQAEKAEVADALGGEELLPVDAHRELIPSADLLQRSVADVPVVEAGETVAPVADDALGGEEPLPDHVLAEAQELGMQEAEVADALGGEEPLPDHVLAEAQELGVQEAEVADALGAEEPLPVDAHSVLIPSADLLQRSVADVPVVEAGETVAPVADDALGAEEPLPDHVAADTQELGVQEAEVADALGAEEPLPDHVLAEAQELGVQEAEVADALGAEELLPVDAHRELIPSADLLQRSVADVPVVEAGETVAPVADDALGAEEPLPDHVLADTQELGVQEAEVADALGAEEPLPVDAHRELIPSADLLQRSVADVPVVEAGETVAPVADDALGAEEPLPDHVLAEAQELGVQEAEVADALGAEEPLPDHVLADTQELGVQEAEVADALGAEEPLPVDAHRELIPSADLLQRSVADVPVVEAGETVVPVADDALGAEEPLPDHVLAEAQELGVQEAEVADALGAEEPLPDHVLADTQELGVQEAEVADALGAEEPLPDHVLADTQELGVQEAEVADALGAEEPLPVDAHRELIPSADLLQRSVADVPVVEAGETVVPVADDALGAEEPLPDHVLAEAQELGVQEAEVADALGAEEPLPVDAHRELIPSADLLQRSVAGVPVVEAGETVAPVADDALGAEEPLPDHVLADTQELGAQEAEVADALGAEEPLPDHVLADTQELGVQEAEVADALGGEEPLPVDAHRELIPSADLLQRSVADVPVVEAGETVAPVADDALGGEEPLPDHVLAEAQELGVQEAEVADALGGEEPLPDHVLAEAQELGVQEAEVADALGAEEPLPVDAHRELIPSADLLQRSVADVPVVEAGETVAPVADDALGAEEPLPDHVLADTQELGVQEAEVADALGGEELLPVDAHSVLIPSADLLQRSVADVPVVEAGETVAPVADDALGAEEPLPDHVLADTQELGVQEAEVADALGAEEPLAVDAHSVLIPSADLLQRSVADVPVVEAGETVAPVADDALGGEEPLPDHVLAEAQELGVQEAEVADALGGEEPLPDHVLAEAQELGVQEAEVADALGAEEPLPVDAHSVLIPSADLLQRSVADVPVVEAGETVAPVADDALGAEEPLPDHVLAEAQELGVQEAEVADALGAEELLPVDAHRELIPSADLLQRSVADVPVVEAGETVAPVADDALGAEEPLPDHVLADTQELGVQEAEVADALGAEEPLPVDAHRELIPSADLLQRSVADVPVVEAGETVAPVADDALGAEEPLPDHVLAEAQELGVQEAEVADALGAEEPLPDHVLADTQELGVQEAEVADALGAEEPLPVDAHRELIPSADLLQRSVADVPVVEAGETVVPVADDALGAEEPLPDHVLADTQELGVQEAEVADALGAEEPLPDHVLAEAQELGVQEAEVADALGAEEPLPVDAHRELIPSADLLQRSVADVPVVEAGETVAPVADDALGAEEPLPDHVLADTQELGVQEAEVADALGAEEPLPVDAHSVLIPSADLLQRSVADVPVVEAGETVAPVADDALGAEEPLPDHVLAEAQELGVQEAEVADALGGEEPLPDHVLAEAQELGVQEAEVADALGAEEPLPVDAHRELIPSADLLQRSVADVPVVEAGETVAPVADDALGAEEPLPDHVLADTQELGVQEAEVADALGAEEPLPVDAHRELIPSADLLQRSVADVPVVEAGETVAPVADDALGAEEPLPDHVLADTQELGVQEAEVADALGAEEPLPDHVLADTQELGVQEAEVADALGGEELLPVDAHSVLIPSADLLQRSVADVPVVEAGETVAPVADDALGAEEPLPDHVLAEAQELGVQEAEVADALGAEEPLPVDAHSVLIPSADLLQRSVADVPVVEAGETVVPVADDALGGEEPLPDHVLAEAQELGVQEAEVADALGAEEPLPVDAHRELIPSADLLQRSVADVPVVEAGETVAPVADDALGAEEPLPDHVLADTQELGVQEAEVADALGAEEPLPVDAHRELIPSADLLQRSVADVPVVEAGETVAPVADDALGAEEPLPDHVLAEAQELGVQEAEVADALGAEELLPVDAHSVLIPSADLLQRSVADAPVVEKDELVACVAKIASSFVDSPKYFDRVGSPEEIFDDCVPFPFVCVSIPPVCLDVSFDFLSDFDLHRTIVSHLDTSYFDCISTRVAHKHVADSDSGFCSPVNGSVDDFSESVNVWSSSTCAFFDAGNAADSSNASVVLRTRKDLVVESRRRSLLKSLSVSSVRRPSSLEDVDDQYFEESLGCRKSFLSDVLPCDDAARLLSINDAPANIVDVSEKADCSVTVRLIDNIHNVDSAHGSSAVARSRISSIVNAPGNMNCNVGQFSSATSQGNVLGTGGDLRLNGRTSLLQVSHTGTGNSCTVRPSGDTNVPHCVSAEQPGGESVSLRTLPRVSPRCSRNSLSRTSVLSEEAQRRICESRLIPIHSLQQQQQPLSVLQILPNPEGAHLPALTSEGDSGGASKRDRHSRTSVVSSCYGGGPRTRMLNSRSRMSMSGVGTPKSLSESTTKRRTSRVTAGPQSPQQPETVEKRLGEIVSRVASAHLRSVAVQNHMGQPPLPGSAPRNNERR